MLMPILALSQKEKVLNIAIGNWKTSHLVLQPGNIGFQDKPRKLPELFRLGTDLCYLTNS